MKLKTGASILFLFVRKQSIFRPMSCMINILNNLISLATLPVGFAIDYLILLLLTPVGLVAVFSSIIFFEYIIVKSIINDPNKISFKMALNYVKKLEPKDVSLISPQWAALGMVFKKKNIGTKEISDNIGITIGAARKLMSGLVDNGYIMRGLNINDGHAFCYITSDKYRGQRKYNNI